MVTAKIVGHRAGILQDNLARYPANQPQSEPQGRWQQYPVPGYFRLRVRILDSLIAWSMNQHKKATTGGASAPKLGSAQAAEAFLFPLLRKFRNAQLSH
jgi:hypothetical protein